MSDAPESPSPEEPSTPAPDEADGAEAAAVEPAPPPREPDPLRDPIVAAMRAALGEDLLDDLVAKGDATVRVATPAWRRAVQWCKDQGFTYFCFLSGIDWMVSPDALTRYENVFTDADAEVGGGVPGVGGTEGDVAPAELTTGVAGGETRFQVLCRLFDTERKVGITLKADLDDDHPGVESVTGVFRGADWHEREAWEMFGFDFAGHPGLRHLYLPTEFEGFPLRKDFPLLARVVKPWPGLVDKEPVPGEDEEEEAAAP